MGILEKEVITKRRRANFKKAVLATLYAAGVISVAILAPNVVGAIAKLNKKSRRNPLYTARTSIARLRSRGLIVFETTPKGTFARLTPKGESELFRFTEGSFLLKPKQWDGRWRIVIYDIKERRKNDRRKFQRTLLSLGFLRLQDSIWIYPYDCEDLIALLKADFKIGKDILYIIAEKIENDLPIRKYFGL